MTLWIDLQDAKARLNIPATNTDVDLELTDFLEAAQDVVESIVGPVGARDVDEWASGGSFEIVLRYYPVLSVTSVTEFNGTTPSDLALEPLGSAAYTGYGYRLDPDLGILTRYSSGTPAWFSRGTGNVHVVYTAGRATVPANIREGALQVVEDNFAAQRSGGPSMFGKQDEGTTVKGFFVSYKAQELLAPSARAPVVA